MPERRLLRAWAKDLRRAAGRTMAEHPLLRRARARRQRRNMRLALGLTAAAMLLLVWQRCPRPPPEPAEARPSPPRAPASAPAVSPRPGPQRQSLSPLERPRLQVAVPPSPDWLDAFRMQVLARGPRLAQCFEGQARPGALRWTCALVPSTGMTSDHTFEPLGGGSLEGREPCMRDVLSRPPLQRVAMPGADATTPVRVSLVIEF